MCRTWLKSKLTFLHLSPEFGDTSHWYCYYTLKDLSCRNLPVKLTGKISFYSDSIYPVCRVCESSTYLYDKKGFLQIIGERSSDWVCLCLGVAGGGDAEWWLLVTTETDKSDSVQLRTSVQLNKNITSHLKNNYLRKIKFNSIKTQP